METMRFDVALASGPAVARRHQTGAVLDVRPRYAGVPDADDWERADRIYVFDPWRDLPASRCSPAPPAGDAFPAAVET